MSDSNGPEESANDPNASAANDLNRSHEWDSDEALEFIKMERSVHGGEDVITNVELARKIIEQAAPQAAMSMVHLAMHAVNENTRSNAAKWVVEFAAQLQTEDGKAAWEKMLPSVVDEAEEFLAKAAKRGEDLGGGYEVGD